MEKCKICSKDFFTKHGIANHFRNAKDEEHVKYFLSNIVPKKCISCGRKLDNRNKDKVLCSICKNAQKIKIIAKVKKAIQCSWCKKEVVGYYSKFNTKPLCEDCSNVAKDNQKLFDTNRNEKNKEERASKRNEEEKKLTADINARFKSIIESDKDVLITSLMKEFNVSQQYIKEYISREKGEEYYRNKVRLNKLKALYNKLNKFLNFRYKITPSKLELNFVNMIRVAFKEGVIK